jgi:hypothetical protein
MATPAASVYNSPLTYYTLISSYLALKAEWLLDVPPGLTFKNNLLSPQFIDVSFLEPAGFYKLVGECFLRSMS